MTTTNGHAARPTRSQVAAIKLRAELAEAQIREQLASQRLKRVKRISEQAEYWNIVDGASEVFDRLRSLDRENLYPLSNANDRRYGANWPFWRHLIEHSRIRATARLVVNTSQFAGGMLSGLTSFVIGEGFVYRIVARKDVSADQALIAAVQGVIDEFSEHNAWPEMEQELYKRARRDGEYFLRYFFEEDGVLVANPVEPEWVLEPPGNKAEESSFGIFNEPGNLYKITGYWVASDGMTDNGEEVPAAEIDHLKINVDRIVKRGLSDFAYDTYEAFRRVGKLIENMTEGAAIQASIALIRQHDTADPAAVDGFNSANASYDRANPVTGKTEKVHRYMAGEVLDIDKGQNYVAPPFSANADRFVLVVQAGLRSAAVRWNAPEWLVSADASNGNYASSLVAESPFVRRCKQHQSRFKAHFLRTLWKAIRHAAESGRFLIAGRRYEWDEVRRFVDIECTPPTVEVRNRTEEAQVNESGIRNGWKSRQMVADEQGIDFQRVERDNEEYEEAHGAPGQQLPMPGEGDDGGQQGDDAGDDGGLDLGGFAGDNPFEGRTDVALALLEEGFTGTITTKDGRKLHYANGKPVKGTQAAATGDKATKGKVAAAAPKDAGKSAGRAEAVKQALAGLKEKGVKVKAAADRIGKAAWDKLPPRTQKALMVSYQVGQYVLHKAETGMRAGKALAVEIAKQKGLSEAGVERTGRILGIVDTIASWTVNVPAAAVATGSPLAAKAAGLLPVASMAYIAFSAVANPFATARAAKMALAGKLAVKGHEGLVEATNEDLAAELLQRFDGMSDEQADWYTALLCAALDETEGDLGTALELADSALKANPEPAAGDTETTEEDESPAASGNQTLLDVPDIRQHDHYSCGAAASMCVGRYFGVGPETLDEWKEALGTNVQQSTKPDEIVAFLRSLGLTAEPRADMTIDDLHAAWQAGSPVICCVQDYGPQVPDKANFEYGHYLTVIGVGFGMVFCQDSSQDNVTKDSGTISMPGRVMIPADVWESHWHDRDIDGTQFNRFGIIVSKAVS